MEYRAKLIGAASLLLCVAFTSQALTLGRIRGAALIGQPLNVVVPVQMDPGEDASAACFEAEVFHADTRQDPSRVKLTVQPAGQAEAFSVRISSSSIVDEPMVTLYLRTLCGQKTSRRYVLLADLPSEVDPAVAPTRPATATPINAPAGAPAPVSGDVVSAAISSAATAVATPAPVPVAQSKAPVPTRPKVLKKVVKAPVSQAPETKPIPVAAPDAPPGQPRLTLDSPVLLSAQIDALTPAPGPSAEAQRDLLKIQTLESDVKALLALAAKNEASLLDMRTRLQAAESERLPSWIVYALGALVLACLAAIVMLLRRQRQTLPTENGHWGASVAAAIQPDLPESGPSPAVGHITMPSEFESQPASLPQRFSPVAKVPTHEQSETPVTQVDVSLLEMSESNFDSLMQTGTAHSAIRKPLASAPAAGTVATPRNLNSDSVFDVRQQAEFFVSLGQTDQAVRILEKQISDSQDPNPHVYLDLLAIFYSLSLKVDFRQFREDFNLLFNGRVPEFVAFKDEGRDLEAYPAALAAISAVWPSAKALEVIEHFTFRDPWGADSSPFDLAAFRDLLLLHAVAQRILMASPSIAPSGRAQSQAAAVRPYFADSGLGGVPLPMPSPYAPAPDATGAEPQDLQAPDQQNADLNLDLNLDLDLSEKSAASAEQTPLLDMDLDLSLPALAPVDLELPGDAAPVANLIDFDIQSPVQSTAQDHKASS